MPLLQAGSQADCAITYHSREGLLCVFFSWAYSARIQDLAVELGDISGNMTRRRSAKRIMRKEMKSDRADSIIMRSVKE